MVQKGIDLSLGLMPFFKVGGWQENTLLIYELMNNLKKRFFSFS